MPSPALHAPTSPPKPCPFPAVQRLVPLCARDAPVCPPTDREKLLLQSSIPSALPIHRQAPIALASSAARIPAYSQRYPGPDRVRPAGDLFLAIAAAVLVADRPDNCSIETSPVSYCLKQSPRALIQMHEITSSPQIARPSPVDQLRLVSVATRGDDRCRLQIPRPQIPRRS